MSTERKSNSLMILGAGLGTRLRPITDEIPKPLVPVGDRPLLGHLLEGGRGFSRIVVNSHYLGREFESYLRAASSVVMHSQEPSALGTAGAVSWARPQLLGVSVVHNGDIWVDAPFEALCARARGAERGIALLVSLRRPATPEADVSGTVGLGERGELVRIRGERFGPEVLGADYVGVMALTPDARLMLPPRGCLVGDFILPALRRGGRVETVTLDGSWLDVGSLEAYWLANLTWLRRKVGQGSKGWWGNGAQCGAGAKVADSVLMAGCRVEGHGWVEEVVALPGAKVVAPISGSVVLPTGRVLRVRRAQAEPSWVRTSSSVR